MLTLRVRSIALNRYRSVRYFVLCLCCLLPNPSLHAQVEGDDAALEKIHRRLTNVERLKYHKPIVFVGEISALGPVFRGVCKSAVNESVDFTISRLLFGQFPEKVMHAGFINCTWQPLPSPPFTLHGTVIVYCEQLNFPGCLTPVEFSEERQKKVEGWIAAIPPGLAKHEDRGDSILWTLYAPLEDPDRLVRKQGVLFDGVINRKLAIHQPRCTSGLERKIEYRVDQVLWDYPDSLLRPGDLVSKEVIDCREASIPTWATGTRVLVYCEALPGQGYDCLAPVRFTDDRLLRVKQWIGELAVREGNPELLKMHHLLHDSLELTSSRPLLLIGKVTWVTPKRSLGVPQTVSMLPTMRVSVTRLLWGYYKEPEVIAICPHRDCSGVVVGANVIAHCRAMDVYRDPPARCPVVSLDASEENVHRAEQWAAQAREQQRTLIVEKIGKYVAAHPADSRSEPVVYRGHATWVGKADDGLPLVHFADTTGRFKREINLLINRPYATDVPIPVEVGKPMITFCVQRDDICYNGEEATAIIEDSNETFHAIEQLIESAHRAGIRDFGAP
jgi:hypothetical protein